MLPIGRASAHVPAGGRRKMGSSGWFESDECIAGVLCILVNIMDFVPKMRSAAEGRKIDSLWFQQNNRRMAGTLSFQSEISNIDIVAKKL